MLNRPKITYHTVQKTKVPLLTSSEVQGGRLPPSGISRVHCLRRDQFFHLDQIARLARLEQIPQRIVGHRRCFQIDGQHRACGISSNVGTATASGRLDRSQMMSSGGGHFTQTDIRRFQLGCHCSGARTPDTLEWEMWCIEAKVKLPLKDVRLTHQNIHVHVIQTIPEGEILNNRHYWLCSFLLPPESQL